MKTNPNNMNTSQTNFLTSVNAVIENNLDNVNFTIEQLAAELQYSYIQTYRKIQGATGCSPSIYIRQIRLNRACQLLVKTDLTINQIAFLVGFKTQSYFSAKFSEYKGISPTQYRKQQSS